MCTVIVKLKAEKFCQRYVTTPHEVSDSLSLFHLFVEWRTGVLLESRVEDAWGRQAGTV